MAENQRQEVEIALGGRTYHVRPTFKLLADIEFATGQPCHSLGMQFLGVRDAKLTDLAVVLAQIVKGERGAPNAEDIGNILFEDGIQNVLGPVGQLLTMALKGHKDFIKGAAKTESAENPLQG